MATKAHIFLTLHRPYEQRKLDNMATGSGSSGPPEPATKLVDTSTSAADDNDTADSSFTFPPQPTINGRPVTPLAKLYWNMYDMSLETYDRG